MAEYPSFPFFVSDYLGKTLGELTLEQHGCFLLLLAFCWQRPNCSLPDDDHWIAGRLGIHGNKWRILRETVLERFFLKDENGEYYSNRLRKERDFVEKSRRNAREKAEKRWAGSRENNNLAKNQHMHPTPRHPKEEIRTSYESPGGAGGEDLFFQEGIQNQGGIHQEEPLQGSAGDPGARASNNSQAPRRDRHNVDQGQGLDSGQGTRKTTFTPKSPESGSPITEALPGGELFPHPRSAAPPPPPSATVAASPDDAAGCKEAAQPKSKPKPKPKPDYRQIDAVFEQFWAVYPKRVDKGAARKAWVNAIKKATPEQIIVGTEAYAASRAGQDPRYTKNPSTFLNSESWANEAPPPELRFQTIDGVQFDTPPRPMNGHRRNQLDEKIERSKANFRAMGVLE